jgi:hypothetical protein
MHSTLSYNLELDIPQNGVANSLYTRTCKRGQQGQLWASLTRRSRELLALSKVSAVCGAEAQSDGGIRTVPIHQIRGSESRCADFDCDFNPLQSHTKGRWLSIAEARGRGKALPPVALIQVGDLYFVRDGHHRISVAQALGQKAIKARVIVWQVAGPLPWETQAQAAELGVGERIKQLRRECIRLGEHVLLSFQALMSATGTAFKSPAVSRQGVDGC